MNGLLPPDGIQAISNYIKRIILLIYLDSAAAQIFFPSNNDAFFISENELETLTFKEVLESRELDPDFFEKFSKKTIYFS
jgi:hypothetical protein